MAARPGRIWGAAAAIALFACASAPAQLPGASPQGTITLNQYGIIPPPTPTPPRKMPRPEDEEESKPIPRGWIIGGAIAAVAALAGLSYGASRVWRSSNLFDRQYWFPRVERVAVRLGGEKSGGHLASVRFTPAKRRAALEPKDL